MNLFQFPSHFLYLIEGMQVGMSGAAVRGLIFYPTEYAERLQWGIESNCPGKKF